jgi:acid phosphatase type 7
MIARLTLLLFMFCSLTHFSQSIVIEPYLQDAEPTSMVIMWETDSDNSTLVEYGLNTLLGMSVGGSSIIGNGSSQIHTAVLTGLAPETRYFYKVITGTVSSSIYEFITPALPAAENNTNLIAMSDMQRDWGNPTIFNQLIQNGVMSFVQDSLGNDLPANLQMVIIPGDLVDNGLNYSEWESTFFDPQHPLFSYVPVYPVLGNHENNTASYFKYFHLPNNGSVGYEEHWWFKDHSNVRIIGLNSNGAYQIAEQLLWLDTVLNTAAADTNIDFVFVQLHHPYHSELWPPGNTAYTGMVIPKLENFSTASGKPSIHFFGHTHGYSRGNSRDHNHMMVNVATAGGNIDFWGEYAAIDYPEYIESMDEYGFVYVTVEAGVNPKLILKRFNMGDGAVLSPISLEDLIVIRKNNNSPNTPIGLFPAVNELVNPDCLILKATDFLDMDNDEHGAAHWQISNSCSDFSAPVFDSWKQYKNSYNEIDWQFGDDLTDEMVTSLLPNTSYCWRVRYRDKSLAWSNWSSPISFTTDSSMLTANLLTNIGAESGTTNWTATAGVIESLVAGECAGTSPYAGTKYFAVGAICVESAFGSANQVVDVSLYSSDIDNGVSIAHFGGYLRDYSGADIPSFSLQFLDGPGNLIVSTDTTQDANAAWQLVQNTWAIPAGTRNIRYIIMGTRTAGTDNDSYFDELFLKLNLAGDSCSQYNPSVNIRKEIETQQLKVYPNPVENTAILNVPNTNGAHLTLKLFNATGQIIKEYDHVHGPTFIFHREQLKSGLYYVVAYENKHKIGYSKLTIR